MNAVRLYSRYVGISIRSQMQYPGSFVMLSLGHIVSSLTEFAGIWALFSRFSGLKGWSFPEVAVFYGLVNIAFALAEGIGRGFDVFSNMVKTGDFDRLLLRPRSSALQVAGQEFQMMRVGRLIQGLAVLIWALDRVGGLDAARVLLIIGAIMGGACLFYALFVLQATLSFWTIESLEIVNTATYGGTEAGQYPLSVYKNWFRRLFTFFVPLACVTYFPALVVLRRQDMALGSPYWFQWAAPCIGILFLLLALQIWKFGVRHYVSTGS